MSPVRPDSWHKLRILYQRLGISSQDLVEHFCRSSGPGGQHVNKRATAVRLTHLPTGITVKVQQDRKLAVNRLTAHRLLLLRLGSIDPVAYGNPLLEQVLQKQQQQKKQKKRRAARARKKVRLT